MREEWEVVDILAGELAPGVEGWSVIMQKPDGTKHGHSFPKLAMEWRAAEYELSDPAEILDMLLHENYVEDEIEPAMVSVLETAKAGTQKERVGRAKRPTLFEAASTSEARSAHRARISEVKSSKVQVNDPNGLLTHITDNHGMNPAAIREKREAVDTHRWMKLYGAFPTDERKEA